MIFWSTGFAPLLGLRPGPFPGGTTAPEVTPSVSSCERTTPLETVAATVAAARVDVGILGMWSGGEEWGGSEAEESEGLVGGEGVASFASGEEGSGATGIPFSVGLDAFTAGVVPFFEFFDFATFFSVGSSSEKFSAVELEPKHENNPERHELDFTAPCCLFV